MWLAAYPTKLSRIYTPSYRWLFIIFRFLREGKLSKEESGRGEAVKIWRVCEECEQVWCKGGLQWTRARILHAHSLTAVCNLHTLQTFLAFPRVYSPIESFPSPKNRKMLNSGRMYT